MINNNIETNIADRDKTQKPRKTELGRNGVKSESQDRELDYIAGISNILREMRYTRQYTQKDMTQRTGIKQQLISRIDRNDMNPRLSTVKKYLEACGVDLEALLRNALEEMQKPY